ncbi:MAG: 50S ribosomal protein L4 [Alphaproteobacteria bacterium]|nr:50S ribosomal protein L4 [Alphaproteobacteria bacterium]MBR6675463.1 50S ribosomal protein L4 [Alphaproteobacteria bacterium]
MKLDVINLDKTAVGSIEVSDAVFGVNIREDIVARVIQWQLDKRRAGTHKTKDIGEVSGSGKKPFKQKGTGHARQGQDRAPQMRHGGVAFGPVVRSHAYSLPKKLRALGMRIALSAKAKNGKLFILDNMTATEPKTKVFKQAFENNGWKSVLFVGGETVDNNFALSARNIVNVDVLPAQGANVYDIVRRDILVLSKEAVAQLEGRLNND